MEIIQTENAPKAIGPYSQAIAARGLIFCSGQVPLEPGLPGEGQWRLRPGQWRLQWRLLLFTNHCHIKSYADPVEVVEVVSEKVCRKPRPPFARREKVLANYHHCGTVSGAVQLERTVLASSSSSVAGQ